MKKLLLLLGLVFLITGCSGDYEVNFGKTIDEEIILNYDVDLYELAEKIDGDSLYIEKELVDSEIPSLKNFDSYYDKKIDVVDDKTKVTLNYSYDYDNFENSYLIDHCFEKSSFVNDDKYYYLSLGGIFDCFGTQEFTLKVKSDYEVIKENADLKEDGYYIWNIENENEDKKVELQISKTLLASKDEGFKISFKLICWILLFVVIGAVLIIKNRIDKKNEI